MDVADVLSRYEVDASEAEVAAVLEEQLQIMPVAAAAAPSAGATDYLTEYGGPTAAAAARSWSAEKEQHQRVQSVMADASRLLAGTLSVDQAADWLGVDASRIRHLINDRPPRLYAVKVGHRRRIPSWQISDNAVLPWMEQIVRAIPDSVHPLDITGLMTTPQDELEGRTPVEHLVSGGPVDPVVSLVADLGRW
jgi:excisionase family DNA binding protein